MYPGWKLIHSSIKALNNFCRSQQLGHGSLMWLRIKWQVNYNKLITVVTDYIFFKLWAWCSTLIIFLFLENSTQLKRLYYCFLHYSYTIFGFSVRVLYSPKITPLKRIFFFILFWSQYNYWTYYVTYNHSMKRTMCRRTNYLDVELYEISSSSSVQLQRLEHTVFHN